MIIEFLNVIAEKLTFVKIEFTMLHFEKTMRMQQLIIEDGKNLIQKCKLLD